MVPKNKPLTPTVKAWLKAVYYKVYKFLKRKQLCSSSRTALRMDQKMSSLILPEGYGNDKPKAERKKVTRAGGVEIQSPERAPGNFGEEAPEIMPSEMKALGKVLTDIQRKTLQHKLSDNDCVLMEDEIQAALTRLGFIGDIVWYANDEWRFPEVSITGRIEDEFDYDQMTWEVQHGLSDGVVGKITMDGRMVEPTKVL